MIYTSYYAKVKTLEKHGIEPISISKGKPKWFRGRSLDCLAPTWDMLKMSEIDYNWNYSIILSKVRQCDVVDFLGKCDVALLCWEADLKECHRKSCLVLFDLKHCPPQTWLSCCNAHH